MSKLQALAAARKKKAQDQKEAERLGVERPMASLSLSGKHNEVKPEDSTLNQSRGFPMRKRKDSNPHEKAPKITPVDKVVDDPGFDTQMDIEPVQQAEPSAFANTMFSTTSRPEHATTTASLFSLPYAANVASTITDPFAGPSPDDVVIAAQSKGSTNPIRPKK